MVSPPKWFLRQLSCIDPTYYIRLNEETHLYEIVKDVDHVIPFRDGQKYRLRGPRIVDVFIRLNDDALNKLRYRKYLGRRMNILENPQKEFNFMKAQETAAKAKEKALCDEMVAEGISEGYKYEIQRKHSVS